MGMLDRVGLLCMIVDGGNNHEIIGRTMLQKIAYFCKYLEWDVGYYQLHYYGPFSFQLTNTIQIAENIKLIEQGNETPHLFRLTDKGKRTVDKFTENICDPIKVKNTRTLISQLSKWEKKEIELVATIDFVNTNTPHIKKEELIGKVHIIKSNFRRTQVQKAHDKWKHLMNSIKKYKRV